MVTRTPAPPNANCPYNADLTRSIIDGIDTLTVDMDRKWGVDRLRLLVDDVTRAKFDRQRFKLNDAVWTGTIEDVKREAERMRTAFAYCDTLATERGAEPLDPEHWEVALQHGGVVRVCRSRAEQHALATEDRAVSVYSLEEIARLIENFPEIAKVKATFPGAEVTRISEPTAPAFDWDVGDELPEIMRGG